MVQSEFPWLYDNQTRWGKRAVLKKKRAVMWIGLVVVLGLSVNRTYAFNPDQLKQLLTTNQCPGCDLSNAGLSGANLFKANLAGANLTGAYLSDANLAGANLTKANLTGAFLNDAYLAHADLTGANLTGAKLFSAILVAANLTGAVFTDAKLSMALWADGKWCADGSVGGCEK